LVIVCGGGAYTAAILEVNNQIILSKVAEIALKFVFKLKMFSHKISQSDSLTMGV